MATQEKQRAIVFGGSSGIGEACAAALAQAGLSVTVTGRDEAKLTAVGARLGVDTASVDASDQEAVRAFFARAGAVDHVVICVSGGKGAGLLRDLDLADVLGAFQAKTIAQLTVAQAAARTMRAGGSITFVTAASARSVIKGTAGLAAVNGALEAAIPILAHELAPIRVNGVSPGIIETPWWDSMPAAAKDAFFATAKKTLPVGRVGQPEEVGSLIAFLVQSGFVTGSIFEIDGGSHLVTQ